MELSKADRLEMFAKIRLANRETFGDGDCNWKRLSELALIALQEAKKYLVLKQYRLFEMYLFRYSEIWQYAESHLDVKDYQVFCNSQNMVGSEYVM